MTKILIDKETVEQALEALESNKRTHYYCEDTWYSCPKHEDGCANEAEGDECNCGADKINAQLDKSITALRQALEQSTEQEPVAYELADKVRIDLDRQSCPGVFMNIAWESIVKNYTPQPQEAAPHDHKKQAATALKDAMNRSMSIAKSAITQPQEAAPHQWVGLTEKERLYLAVDLGAMSADWIPFMEAVEARLKEKNT